MYVTDFPHHIPIFICFFHQWVSIPYQKEPLNHISNLFIPIVEKATANPENA